MGKHPEGGDAGIVCRSNGRRLFAGKEGTGMSCRKYGRTPEIIKERKTKSSRRKEGGNDKGDRMMEQKVYEMLVKFSKGYEIANETSKTLIIRELCLMLSKICSIA